jgi:hypothetical protein
MPGIGHSHYGKTIPAGLRSYQIAIGQIDIPAAQIEDPLIHLAGLVFAVASMTTR